MAHMVDFQLTSSRGTGKVIFCHGLEAPAAIVPIVQGEPLLTAQAFYYLEEIESVARMSTDPIPAEFQVSQGHLARRCEYIIDNYLFAYSLTHPESRLSTKITDFRYWEYEGEPYRGYDHNHTQALALDWMNDPSIRSVRSDDSTDLLDWCLIANYTYPFLDQYVANLKCCTRKYVHVETDGHEYLGTGSHSLPLVSTKAGLLDYHQAMALDGISFRDFAVGADTVLVATGSPTIQEFRLPCGVIHMTRLHSSELLAYYFAGIREEAPIARFRSFYNVLEYFFDSAPSGLGESARTEREQMSCVVRWVVDDAQVKNFVSAMGCEYGGALAVHLQTSSGRNIAPLEMNSATICADVSRWIYDIRCACIHSKASRAGAATARFVPFSNDENAVSLAIPLLQWLAVACIQKDSAASVV